MVLRVVPGCAASWLAFAALFALWGGYDLVQGNSDSVTMTYDVLIVSLFITTYFLDRRRELAVTADGVAIRGFLRSERIEWTQVSHLEVRDATSQRRVRLHLNDGGMRRLPFPSDGLGPFQRDRAFDEKVAALREQVAIHAGPVAAQ